MTSITIAQEIFSELGEPTNITVNEIDYWLKNNIGKLNNLINTTFSIDADTLEITPEIGDDAKVIYKTMYFIKYYGLAINNNLGASGIDFILEYSSDNDTIRKASRTEAAKVYLQLKKQFEEELLSLVTGYKSNASYPVQIVGEDSLMIENVSKYNRAIE